MASCGHVVATLCMGYVVLFVCSAHPFEHFENLGDENVHRVKRGVAGNRDSPNVFHNAGVMQNLGGKHPVAGNNVGSMGIPENPANAAPGKAGGKMKHINQMLGNQPAGVKSQLIASSPECKNDVQRFCSQHARNNFALIDCLQNEPKGDEELEEGCQHYLWLYKLNLTKDPRFDAASQGVCQKDLQKLPECHNLAQGTGQIIPCLLENFGNVTNRACKQFIRKMANIVFSDYRLVYHFAEFCKNDIMTHSCGRIGQEDETSLHSQGKTIACLAEKMDKLSSQCKLQVLRVFELSSDDYHMDRQLFYACRLDREHFCANITSGNGRVFKCLFKHMTSREMSPECQNKLELREKLAALDVRIEHTFYDACHKAIQQYGCEKHIKDDPGDIITRAKVLRCLEGAIKDDRIVEKKCKMEMRELRTRIVDDYKISPDLVSRCSREITEHCGGLDQDGNTLHCLMAIAKMHGTKAQPDHPTLSDRCRAELSEVLMEADIGEDVTVDKSLMSACGGVIHTLCEHVQPGQGNIMTCLMENLDHEDMTDECEGKLLEIQYFIVRDFRLDDHLYRACRKDAKKLCSASEDWYKPDMGPVVFSCLHGHIRHPPEGEPQVSRACKHEVKRVMRERAMSVDLHPEIEEACMEDLIEHCSEDREDTDKGAEIACLQEHVEDIKPKCREVLSKFTEEESEDIELDRILMKACTPMIKKFCGDELENDGDSDEIMECLIENKNNHDMDFKCAAGITHHQLITMEDYRFSHKFKQACQKSVTDFCSSKVKKAEVVLCLSEHVRNDTLFDKPHRIEQECRRMLQVEILQRGENIDLDPKLKLVCRADVKKFCSKVNAGNAQVIECLKEHRRKLSGDCHKVIFQREKDEFAIADFGLISACKRMIKEHCSAVRSEPEIFACLKDAKDIAGFDQKCRTVVLRRQIAQSHDFRLNPQLAKACHLDIPKFCKDVLASEKNDMELEGKVVSCLEKQFIANKLSTECGHEIKGHVREKARDINLAPVLLKVCRLEINRLCSEEFQVDNEARNEIEIKESGQGRVEECLKEKFRLRKLRDQNCIKEVAYLVEETRIDVNVDPLLQKACQKDIDSACRGFAPGEGRQMSCLLALLDDRPTQLTPQCRRMLELRRAMWEYAAQVAPVEGFQELFDQIKQSPAKSYIFAVIAAVIFVIFIVGISCGRVTKRVRAEMKNK